MESAFEPKPNVKAPSAIKIAVLSMCSPPCNDDDHSCRRKHDRLPPSNSRVELRSLRAWAAARAASGHAAGAAEQRDELATAAHSITSSARRRIEVGRVTPSAFAVFRFRAKWKLSA